MGSGDNNEESLPPRVEFDQQEVSPDNETTELNPDELEQVSGGISNNINPTQGASVKTQTFDKTSAEMWPWIKS
jgi:hypothetical protein